LANTPLVAGVAGRSQLLLVRFAGGCWRVHRLRISAVAEPVSPWQASAERLAARLQLEAMFRVVESRLVDGPSVIGLIRPVILLPVAALTNLAPCQIEALLVHELAHIRRRDMRERAPEP
jgi:beta-lactamase regulating signal transducer with metallopeptidase domain